MKHSAIIILLLFLNSCYIGKPLKEPATMLVKFATETKVNACINCKYISETKWNDYKQAFINGIKSESSFYNLTIVEDEKQSADFVLTISSFTVSESSSSETVNDVNSKFNGQTFQLSNCSADATFKLYNGNHSKLLGEWSSNAFKDEKISNNRNFGDFVFGTNKDNSEYRYKGLDDNIFTVLSEKCGKHVIAKLTRKINKK